MRYSWLGMRVLNSEEVDTYYLNGKLNGCYKLFPDGTEAEITRITLKEIVDHYNAGGEFGEELPTVELTLPDGKRIAAPEVVDISAVDALDEIEYSLWHTIEEYLVLFGIRTMDDTPDWATVKGVQEKLLEILTESGVNFKFLTDEQSEAIQMAMEEKEAENSGK